MRLLNAKTLELEVFDDVQKRPQYAILSHTWGNEEVSYQEFKDSNPSSMESKSGYTKITSACRLALRRGWRYLWIDTCCMDKASSTELSEAINSMFRWYEQASICLIYLADVPPQASPQTLDKAFDSSRWFTRGWTLQELLAPKVAEFYACDWSRIARRDQIASRIRMITGIDELYLKSWAASRQDLLCSASVAERMSWAARRRTTREEDIAYCLLGIFQVNMPLIYGEGPQAFLRLQEQILNRSFDASLFSWNVCRGNSSIPPRDLSIFSALDPLSRMIHWLENPWYCPQIPSKYSRLLEDRANTWSSPAQPLIGLLAPGVACLQDCGDIVCKNSSVDCSLVMQSITINLPNSMDKDPYVVLPCHSRHAPWKLLAIPLRYQHGRTYARLPISTQWVDYKKWYQWPSRQITIAATAPASNSSSSGVYLQVRGIPDSFKLHQVYFGGEWQPAPDDSRRHVFSYSRDKIQDPWNDFDPDSHGPVGLLLKDQTSEFGCAIIDIMPESTQTQSRRSSLLRKLTSYITTSIRCRCIVGTKYKDVLNAMKDPSWLKNHKHSELRYCYINARIIRKDLVNCAILEVNLIESTKQLQSLVSKYHRSLFLQELPEGPLIFIQPRSALREAFYKEWIQSESWKQYITRICHDSLQAMLIIAMVLGTDPLVVWLGTVLGRSLRIELCLPNTVLLVAFTQALSIIAAVFVYFLRRSIMILAVKRALPTLSLFAISVIFYTKEYMGNSDYSCGSDTWNFLLFPGFAPFRTTNSCGFYHHGTARLIHLCSCEDSGTGDCD